MKNDHNKFIIDKSEYVKPGQKATALGITLIFWAVFIYLLQPLLSIIAWWLNIKIFYNQMIVLGGYQAFLETLALYLIVIAILGGGLILWGLINFWRFKNKDMRAESEMSSIDDVARDFGLNVDQLKNYQASNRLVIEFDQEDKLKVISRS
ncbi:MAG: poly-beta-1,6-N-acetyl-D-glucosamine biosynthesis protein PgaD [Pseudomonadota bacterium]